MPKNEYPESWKNGKIQKIVKDAAHWHCVRDSCQHVHDPENGYTLTVHHLDGDKANVKWWNLAALCQRCHLHIQAKVEMDRIWMFQHSDWFKPYVAGYYASRNEILNQDPRLILRDVDTYIKAGQFPEEPNSWVGKMFYLGIHREACPIPERYEYLLQVYDKLEVLKRRDPSMNGNCNDKGYSVTFCRKIQHGASDVYVMAVAAPRKKNFIVKVFEPKKVGDGVFFELVTDLSDNDLAYVQTFKQSIHYADLIEAALIDII